MGALDGQVIIITGASRGIGEAAAHALAKDGARVVLTGRDKATVGKVAEAVGPLAEAHACDMADYAAVAALAEATRKRHGRLDALVNNAGILDPIATIVDSDPAAWARNVQTNLVGAYHAIRAVLPGMIAAGGGSIVNLSSGAAIRPLEGWSAYCAAKAGLHMLTRSVALETEGKNIRVFGFQPGMTDTYMHVQVRASGINPLSKTPRETLYPTAHPAMAIAYLLTPAADDLAGQEFSLRDEPFRKRLGLS
ncbi:MAG TPA: SDR family oxidoreductase [Rhodopila sp.]|uniref:SDR family NAD(P)-dependent oxidoreductase n=1 Tax=Rhodopila sp. TaxID=2480087 RepID=UPI002CDE7328|nr:SDR family oxidoreductase [Rhodopila sp.]HVY15208.1 SDR family oxidoreductase [Rhodopila sp.]